MPTSGQSKNSRVANNFLCNQGGVTIKQKATVASVADRHIEVEKGQIDAAVARALITLDIDVDEVQIRPKFYLDKK